MANKALVIDVDKRQEFHGGIDKWEAIGNMQAFTRDIVTPKLDENADKSAIVSGIPTVYARANMFSLALSYTGDSMSNTSVGMIEYYNDLVDEWKGLIACIALDSGKLQIKRVELGYSDGRSVAETSNIYESKGAFGNMLFNRAPLWTEQIKDNVTRKPFINIIKYNNQVVGGTSPESLLFTAPSYSIPANDNYAPNGKFTDPVKHGRNLDETKWLALYAYVKNLVERLNNEFTMYYQDLDESLRPNYAHISTRLQQWIEEIKSKIHDDVDKAAANPVMGFTSPFDIIFNYSDTLYGSNGTINTRKVEGYTEFKAEDLLLKRGSEIAQVSLCKQAEKHYSELPVQLLAADVVGSEEGEKAFFALPLSEVGLKIFGSSVSALVGQQENVAIKSRMRADYFPEARENNLNVYLTLNTEDGKTKSVVVVYTVKSGKYINSDILLWPNFISKQWNKYFLYSEMPHGVTTIDFNAIPFIIVNPQNDGATSNEEKANKAHEANGNYNMAFLTDDPEELKRKGVDSKLLVTADHRVADSPYKYEIYQSNLPFSGLKLTCGTVDRDGNEKMAGFLLIRYAPTGGSSLLPESMMDYTVKYNADVTLGFDFGSTNSSVAYYDPREQRALGFVIKNRRVSLFGNDKADEKDYNYKAKDFFFFSKKSIKSNALKSVLTLHDPRRIPNVVNGTFLDMPVAGGMPCFMSNLPIKSVTSNTINLEFGDNLTVTLINNMKWSDSDIDKHYKAAYLRTVLLMTYAELFKMGLKPAKLNWSYPSTMGRNTILTQYNPIWQELSSDDVCPILGEDGNKLKALEVTGIAQQKIDKGGVSAGQPGAAEQRAFGRRLGMGLFKNNAEDTDAEDLEINSEEEGPLAWRKKTKVQKPEVQEKVIDLIPSRPDKKLNFSPIDTRYPMTEACASANYTAQDAQASRHIVYCFDVGGSTTDISAVFNRDGKKPSMIKQNSILFAAQKISQVICQMSDEFKEVLKKVCDKYDIQLIGFNKGESRYNSETASYYYEQIVDILNPEQLRYFYSCIAECCKRLFAVNMYVTGLIMYYAGQLYIPLGTAIYANKEPGFAGINGVEPVFEGKGARIFDWLCTKDMSMAEIYFKELFIAGAQSPGIPADEMIDISEEEIDLGKLKAEGKGDDEVKYEVSKGLASENGVIEKPDEAFEIFGENGFKGYDDKNGKVYNYRFDTNITAEWMGEMGGMIRQPVPNCECFAQFLDIYGDAVQQILGLSIDIEEMKRGLGQMKIEQYITQKLPRFKEAMARYRNNANQPFDYVAPIIIIEGLKFYDEYLLKCFKK